MQVRFGWTLDGAPWAPRIAAEGARADLTLGPRGLIELLQVRLGLAHPPVAPSLRVAQYRSAMQVADHHWFRESFAVDPWNTAAHVLALRDAAIEAGWDGSRPQDPSVLPRLDALAAIETQIQVGPDGAEGTTLVPGAADDLRDVLSHLTDLSASAAAWPLGIDVIRVQEPVAELPGLFPEVFAQLTALGVEVVDAEVETEGNGPTGAVTGTVPRLRIIEAPEEFSAAEACARVLADVAEASDGEGPSAAAVLVGAPTILLDHELGRRGLPTLGAADASRSRLTGQLLPLFLSIIRPQLDVYDLAAFLDFTITCTDEDGALMRVGILPAPVRRALLGALEKEPGVQPAAAAGAAGASAPGAGDDAADADDMTAWDRAIAGLKPTHAQIARDLTALLQPDEEAYGGGGTVNTDLLTARLTWLNDRLTALGRSDGAREAAQQIRGHIDLFTRLLDDTTSDPIGGRRPIMERELADIVAASAPSTRSRLTTRTASAWTVLTDPAHLDPAPGTHLIWWSGIDDTRPTPTIWDPAEAAELTRAGARITPVEQVAALQVAGRLTALRAYEQITVVIPKRRAGEAIAIHPLLSHLALDIAAHDRELHGRDVDKVLTHPKIRTTAADQARALLDTGRATLPELQIPTPPTTLERTLPGGGEHLLPRRLSFTQIDTLLSDNLTWVLKYGYGIRRGHIAEVPAGSRMIGSFIHAVVETLVKRGSVGPQQVPTEDTITAVFDELAPRFASPLTLPGARAERESVRRSTVDALSTLFGTLAEQDIAIRGVEEPFHVPLDLAITRPGETAEHRTSALIGSIDLSARDRGGDPVVIDLKWTRAVRYYRDLVTTSRALQLATYLHALSREEGRSPADGYGTAGYFLLEPGEFISDDPRIGDLPAGPDTHPELVAKMRATLDLELSRIAAGDIGSDAADLAIATGRIGDSSSRTRKEHAEAVGLRDAAAAEDGRLFHDHRFDFNDFTLITGLTGDFT